MLQWGRTFSSAESCKEPSIQLHGYVLQWGRTFSSAESSECEELREANVELQWGRTFSSAERYSSIIPLTISTSASMGPHFFKCGKADIETGLSCELQCFNGAALFQVRKVPFGLSNAYKSRIASMGPHFFKCGKLHEANIHETHHLASMGPHFFKCGKPNLVLKTMKKMSSFNGAALFQVRKVIKPE